MGYTHYYSELASAMSPDLKVKMNAAYSDMLNVPVTIQWAELNLLEVFRTRNIDEETCDLYFHEFGSNENDEPILFWKSDGYNFIKTNCKAYDVPVVLTLILAKYITQVDFNSDWVANNFNLNSISEYIDSIGNNVSYNIIGYWEVFDKYLSDDSLYSLTK